MMFRMSWDLLKASTSELTDSSLPEEVEKEIEDIICSQEQIHEPQYPVTIHMEPKKFIFFPTFWREAPSNR